MAILVSNNNDSGPGSLRQAVLEAVSGETIEFTDDFIITLTTGEIIITKNLTINSLGKAITIDGNGASRIFSILSGSTVLMKRVSLNNGNASQGGAILVADNSALTLINSNLHNNTVSDVGAAIIIASDSAADVVDTAFSGNNGGYFVINNYGILSMKNVTFSNNSAAEGWSVYNRGTCILNNGVFYGNSYNAGAICNTGTFSIDSAKIVDSTTDSLGGIFNAGTLTAANVTISGCTSNYGGAIYNVATLSIKDSTFSGNKATAVGGAIANYSDLSLSNCTLSGNIAADSAGAIFNTGRLSIVNSTLSNNKAASAGGAIRNYGTLRISFSTIAENEAPDVGAGIYNYSQLFCKNSIFAKNGTSNYAGVGSLTAQGENFSTDNTCPGFTQVTAEALKLGPLALNPPGTTATRALLKGSSAIDQITDCTDVDGKEVVIDQRGISRPQNGLCDAGAYEAVQELLDISETYFPEDPKVGFPLTYNLLVRNLGRIPVTNIKITDKLPARVDFLTASPGYEFNPATRELFWIIGTLGIGQSQTLTLKVKPRLIGIVTNSITAASPDSQTYIGTYRVVVGGGFTLDINMRTIIAWSYPIGVRGCDSASELVQFLEHNMFKLINLQTLGGWTISGIVIEYDDYLVRLSDAILE